MNIHLNEIPQNIGLYVAIDSEWFGIEKLWRPTTGRFASLQIATNPEDVYVILDPSLVPDAIKAVSDAVWIIHNAKFDIMHLRRLTPIPPRKKLVDTMLIEQIMYGGYYNYSGFTLGSLARRYLGIYVNKDEREEFIHTNGEMDEKKIEYAANDAIVLYKIWQEQKKLVTNSFMRIWKEVDLLALWAVLDMKGFRVDVNGWEELAKRNRERANEIDAKLPFNPRSSAQVVPVLRKFGFKGIPSSNDKVLTKYLRKYPKTEAAEMARMIQESRMYSKRASSYGINLFEEYLEQEGEGVFAIWDDWKISGAETGRMAAHVMQTIPSRETKEYRELLISRPNHDLVIADYSQQEVFIGAHRSEDEKLISICNSGQDIYIGVGSEIFGKPIVDKKDPLRKTAKEVVLGLNYGMSEYGLADKIGCSPAEAAEIILKFRKAFRQHARWSDKQRKEKTFVETEWGRRCYLNFYSSQRERNALNSPIQGTAADMMKRAIGLIRYRWNFDCEFGLVAPVHDEAVFDVPTRDSDKVADLVEETMVEVANSMCPGMKFRAEATIGSKWSDKE